jgi:hypothetical protein
VAEQLSVYQVNLKEKNQHMKALAAELNMYRAQVIILCVLDRHGAGSIEHHQIRGGHGREA